MWSSPVVHQGRHFLQVPGPTSVPDRVLRALAMPAIDHRGPEFADLTRSLLPKLGQVFGTREPVVIYPSSGTGASEAALVNTLSPGDHVLFCETGHFSTLWSEMATRLGLRVEVLTGDWHTGADPSRVRDRLRNDHANSIRAVCVVHNETSTGVTSRVPDIRRAIDEAGHSALLLVDAISSLATSDYRHDDWGVDVTVGGSQKGLMLPPGLSFNVASSKARAISAQHSTGSTFWRWAPILESNANGYFPYTPATNMLFGLHEACEMLLEEGLERVFARHRRLAVATRAAVGGWGLEVVCRNEDEHSNSLTAILAPASFDADAIRSVILDRFDMSLGMGLGRLKGKAFRIGHLGHFNELSLIGTLAGVQMGLELAGVPIGDGVSNALKLLVNSQPPLRAC